LAQSPSTNGSINGSSGSMRLDGASGTKIEANSDDIRGGSEDEDSLTPAQSRRKAQNRAA
jgi:AP-1-like factor